MPKIISITDSPRHRARLVDEAGRLASKVAKLKPILERFAEIKKNISSWMADDPAHFDRLFSGKLYQAKVSAREYKREITDMQAVYDKMGHEQFLQHCALAFKVLDVFWPEAVDDGAVKKERTGPREVTIEPRQPKQEAA